MADTIGVGEERTAHNQIELSPPFNELAFGLRACRAGPSLNT